MLSAKVETLIAVSETLNFTRAAEQLNLTQPAVSHHIKQLEEELIDGLMYIEHLKECIKEHGVWR